MRVLVFSDMHGNSVGLDAVLTDCREEQFNARVCLGDTIQGGHDPVGILNRLRDLDCPVVMGNADAWLITGVVTEDEGITGDRRTRMETIRDWSLSQLSEKDRQYVQSFQPTVEVPLGNGQTLVCSHGTPSSFDQTIFPTTSDEDLKAFLDPQENTHYCGGHTHVQFVRHMGDMIFFNPGSAGTALRHDQPEGESLLDPFAEYAVLTVNKASLRIEFRRVPMDIDQIAAESIQNGMPFAETIPAKYKRPRL
jgi:predicted phosphodiesterase